jgi:hypothetical protein
MPYYARFGFGLGFPAVAGSDSSLTHQGATLAVHPIHEEGGSIMAKHLTLLVTNIHGSGAPLGSRELYQVHVSGRLPPIGDDVNLSLEFHADEASKLLELMQANSPQTDR